MQVIVTERLRKNIISSEEKGTDQRITRWGVAEKSIPICRRMAAKVICSVLKMKVKPPAARKKLARISVGGREGSTECGGRSQRKK